MDAEKAGVAISIERIYGSVLSGIGEISIFACVLLDSPEYTLCTEDLC